jgi:methionyl-tRNA formyltransferase
MGSSTLSEQVLDALLQISEIDVVGVVTLPRSFPISYSPEGVTNVLHADLVAFAAERCLPFLEIRGLISDPEHLEQLRSWGPDFFVVAGWYHLVPASWRVIAPAYGLHASLLPRYRGGAPLVWAMINGEEFAGVTLFQFSEKVDAGPIVGQIRRKIDYKKTIKCLYESVVCDSVDLIYEFIPTIANGTVLLKPQEEECASIFPQRSPADGEITLTKSTEELIRFIRAQSRPYPGAFVAVEDRRIIVWDARLCPDEQVPNMHSNGHVLIAGRLYLRCNDGVLVSEDFESK